MRPTNQLPQRQAVLCFHGIGTPQRPLEPGEERYWISRTQFTQILTAIQSERQRTIRLTFDDGNASDHAEAFPALCSRGLQAEFFVIADRIDQPGSLSRSQLVEMTAEGMTIGNHGMTHRPWTLARTRSELETEVVRSRALIEHIIGSPVRHAAFPLGRYNRRVLQVLRAHHYELLYSVDGGTASPDTWIQSRYTVRADDTPEAIAKLMRHPDQSVYQTSVRRVKRLIKAWR